jgi:quercetin dioxygenase-like cupin family protein
MGMSFHTLDEIEQRELLPGLHVRFLHSENMTAAYWFIEAGSEMPVHTHPHEQITNVLEGELELTLGEESRVLGPGTAAVIAPEIPHGGRAVSDCRVIDVFHPVREDYR